MSFVDILASYFAFSCFSYVGNIDQLITEEFVRALFGQVGSIVHAKIFYDWVIISILFPYSRFMLCIQGSFSVFAFLEFSRHQEAVRALAFNGRILFNRVCDSVT